jgi:hypothetical protein
LKITIVPIQLLPIENDGFHILVKGKINRKKALFLVDTGASRSVFDQHGIRKFMSEATFEANERLSTGLGTNSMPSMVTEIASISFGDLVIKDYTAIAIDLKHVFESYDKLGLPNIDGILGGDILVTYRCVINYGKRRLKFYEKNK